MQVVEQGLNATETVNPHQLFVIQRAVGLTELGVPFMWNCSHFVVVRHGFTLLLDAYQIPSQRLFALNGDKQGFEVTFTKSLCFMSLNHLKKQCRAVFHGLGKNLK